MALCLYEEILEVRHTAELSGLLIARAVGQLVVYDRLRAVLASVLIVRVPKPSNSIARGEAREHGSRTCHGRSYPRCWRKPRAAPRDREKPGNTDPVHVTVGRIPGVGVSHGRRHVIVESTPVNARRKVSYVLIRSWAMKQRPRPQRTQRTSKVALTGTPVPANSHSFEKSSEKSPNRIAPTRMPSGSV